ncbi:hypothetical protein RHMOL_Rhmol01G0340200 [Rhododendron molle]|uniref:Uncharacterized protein n=1 Tax=Rhododendron molle TaxID=49168 RepID=A0ACC0QAJ3_RHOML|nr:hypothetical protein RHMOL_Rhmol01G0340200 [Rhododendron molle]
MVSIRRRRLLGLCSGRSSFLYPLLRFCNNGNASGHPIPSTKNVSVHPMPSVDAEKPKEPSLLYLISWWYVSSPCITSKYARISHLTPLTDAIIFRVFQAYIGITHVASQKTIPKASPGSSNLSGSSTSKDQHTLQYPVPEVKRRKRHRRKHFENQEPCVMRGVYLKNMKWQAAIKVDKKQIHLGTVGSQEEAARLYDRAAFMCGREPNFELSEEEKQELRKFKWDEFLAMTRSSITNKKLRRRRSGAGPPRKSEPPMQDSDWEGEEGVNGFSASEDIEPGASVS